jgi:hypothetical protein
LKVADNRWVILTTLFYNREIKMKHMKLLTVAFLLTGVLGLCMPDSGESSPVTLQNATATFSQTVSGPFNISESIDNNYDGTLTQNNGWAIYQGTTTNQTAVFETEANVGIAGGTVLTFRLHQLFAYPDVSQHTIGRFRLSVTTDDRSTFADGLQTNGDVDAGWTILTPLSNLSANGATLTKQSDSSILAGGTSPNTDVYTVVANTTLAGITGVRLEVLEDPSLPSSGPGRQPTNGNFVLTEFTLDAKPVPIPTAAWLLGTGLIGLVGLRRRLRR